MFICVFGQIQAHTSHTQMCVCGTHSVAMAVAITAAAVAAVRLFDDILEFRVWQAGKCLFGQF